MSDDLTRQICERLAALETGLRSHEDNAVGREILREKKFDLIFKKLDEKDCTLHAARMIELGQDVEDLGKYVDKNSNRITVLEKVVWTGLGGLSALMFIFKFIVR